MSTNKHDELLDRLQAEVNRVLEQTGKLFATVTAHDNPKAVAMAHIVNLKKSLPDCNQRFHEALDNLEEELQIARLVMRRDLAICRERSGLQMPSATELPTDKSTLEASKTIEPEMHTTELTDFPTSNDIVMEDPQLTEALLPESLDQINDDSIVEKEANPLDELAARSDLPRSNLESQQDAAETDPTAVAPLHIDTQAQLQKDKPSEDAIMDEDRQPDTGTFSNANDLDSLFGGPMSAGAGETNDFNLNPATTDDFDFDAFGTTLDNDDANNDNITSLLPDLEDFANAQPAGGDSIDFDALFNTDLSANDDGQADGAHPGMQHRDSTFDGLQDLADFDVNDFTGGNDGTGPNADQEFDFLIE